MLTFIVALVTVPACFLLLGILQVLAKLLGVYVVVPERTCYVYTLFGKVTLEVSEPGLHFLWAEMGIKALVINIMGSRYTIDMRLDQEYIRSQGVNSAEGAPMGIGIWYEMYVSSPQAYLFKNADPRGSLRSNVSNSTVRTLSNLPLEQLLTSRHPMSKTVRDEVSPLSHEWGYRLGSVYVRKVHFRDHGMIQQIEAKVVNRLRQVTATIKQSGSNQVNIITSTAERQAAIEFAKAAAVRPVVVGSALRDIMQDPEVSAATFEVLEAQRLIDNAAASRREGGSPTSITLVPQSRHTILPDLVATR